jgi:hypothetical protein
LVLSKQQPAAPTKHFWCDGLRFLCFMGRLVRLPERVIAALVSDRDTAEAGEDTRNRE